VRRSARRAARTEHDSDSARLIPAGRLVVEIADETVRIRVPADELACSNQSVFTAPTASATGSRRATRR
jgi:hypothetical protein